MNIFVSIEIAYSFRKVTYYTVTLSGHRESLARKFIRTHSTPEHIESMRIMKKYLEIIGNDIGASHRYFRSEGYAGGDARALPPPYVNIHMRWYGMIVSRQIIFLFGGGLKTRRTAQQCPNVSQHFYLANRIAKKLQFAITRGDIIINEATKTLTFNPDYKLEL